VFSHKKQRFIPNKRRYRGIYLDGLALFGLFFRIYFLFSNFCQKVKIFGKLIEIFTVNLVYLGLNSQSECLGMALSTISHYFPDSQTLLVHL